MRILLAGFGEVGKAFRKCLEEHIVLILDPAEGFRPLEVPFDILLVCFPWSDEFLDLVSEYQEIYTPRYTVIASTVPVGISGVLDAIHTPVEGRHPNLLESLRSTPRWLSGKDALDLIDVFDFGPGCKICERQEETELLKLLSTAVYGLNIEFARYMNQCCQHLGIEYKLIMDFFKDYNALYQSLNEPGLQKYVLKPPLGKIGGHCVLPNAKLLNDDFPNYLLKYIINTNEHLRP